MTPEEWATTRAIVRTAPGAELQAALDATAGLPLRSLTLDVRLHLLACRWELWQRRLAHRARRSELPTSRSASYGE